MFIELESEVKASHLLILKYYKKHLILYNILYI